MKKSERIELIEKAEKSPLWVLELRISKQNILLENLAGQGVKSNDSKWKRLILKRNVYRTVAFDKLKKWMKDKSQEKNPSYSDYLASINHKKMEETEYLENGKKN